MASARERASAASVRTVAASDPTGRFLTPRRAEFSRCASVRCIRCAGGSWSRSSPGSSSPAPSPPPICCGPRTATATGSQSASATTGPRAVATPPSTAATTTTTSRRGSGQPVTFAFAGDIHFEGVLRNKLAANPATVLAPIAPVLGSRRPDRGEPRDRGDRPGHARAEGVHVPGARDGAHRARGRGHRRGEHGEQPRHGLRTGRPAGLARGPRRERLPDHRDRQQRHRGVRAVPSHDQGPAHRGDRRDAGARREPRFELDRDRCAGRARVGQGRAPARRRGAGRAHRRATRSSSSCTGVSRPTPARAGSSSSWRARSWTRVPTSSSVGTRTGLQGAGRMDAAFVGYGLGNFAFYAKPGPGARVRDRVRDGDRPGHRLVPVLPGGDQQRRPATARAARPRRTRSRRGTTCAVAPASRPEVDYRRAPTTSSACSTRTPRSSTSRGAAIRRSCDGSQSTWAAARRSARSLWGDGEPELVLIHGGAQNAHTWDTVALALDRPLVALDLPGHGHSSHRDDHAYWPARERGRARDRDPRARARGPCWSSACRSVVSSSIALTDRAPDLVRALVLVDVTPGVNREKASAIAQFIDGPEYFESFDEILERTVAFNPTRTESSLRRGILHNAVEDAGRSLALALRPARGAGAAKATTARIMPGHRHALGRDRAHRGAAHARARRALAGRRRRTTSTSCCAANRTPRVEVFDGAGHSIQGDKPIELAGLLRSIVDG